MKIQTLVVTMDQNDHGLLEKMNIQTDALIGNQCDRNEIEAFDYNGHQIRWFSLCEKGVGLNRNTILMRSDADVCVFADDDMVFYDGYEKTVEELFQQYPRADILLLNLDEEKQTRHKNTKAVKINRWNYGKYGAARFVIRRQAVHMAGISFSLLFGGGAPFGSGEDSIFLHDCIKHGLNVLAVPVSIARLTADRPSTWFGGYTDKLFFDKGVFFGVLYGRYGKWVALYQCIKHGAGRFKEYGWRRAYTQMLKGYRQTQQKRKKE